MVGTLNVHIRIFPQAKLPRRQYVAELPIHNRRVLSKSTTIILLLQLTDRRRWLQNR